MTDKNHKPVGKRALLGAILGKHVDAQVSLLTVQPILSVEAAEVGSTPDPTLPDENANTTSESVAAPAISPMPASKVKSKKKKKSATKTTEPKTETIEPTVHWWRRRAVLNSPEKVALLIAMIVLLFSAPLATTYGYYQQRVMPGVQLAGQPAGGKSAPQVRSLVEAAISKTSFEINNEGQILNPSKEELGATYDIDKTVNDAMAVRRYGGPQQRLAWWQNNNVPINVSFDRTKINEYEHNTLKVETIAAKDAELKYENGAYTVIADEFGSGRGIASAVAELEKGQTAVGKVQMVISDQPVPPKVSASDLKPLQTVANKYLQTSIKVNLNGKDYQPSKDEIKDWLAINSDPANKPFTVGVDNAKVEAYVEGLSKQVYIAPVTQIISKNQDQGGAEQVLTNGRKGRQLKDKQATTKAIVEALNSQTTYVASLSTEEVAFKTESINVYDRYIEVDISDFRLVAYEKGEAIRTFTISTGDVYHKTPPGEYAIYRKTRVQTMSGGTPGTPGYFKLPNVEWINWFYGEYAIHGAYWNKVIGVKNVSHGCVNMFNVDAEFIYNWAPVGTKIVIHS